MTGAVGGTGIYLRDYPGESATAAETASLATYWLKGFLPILALSLNVGIMGGVAFTYSEHSGIPTLGWRLLIVRPLLALAVKR